MSSTPVPAPKTVSPPLQVDESTLQTSNLAEQLPPATGKKWKGKQEVYSAALTKALVGDIVQQTKEATPKVTRRARRCT